MLSTSRTQSTKTYINHGLRLIYLLTQILFFYGIIAFAAQFIASEWGNGFINDSIEWPIGLASGVVRDSKGDYIVPLKFSGRIQIYNAENQYVRGWFINASGGEFKLQIDKDNNITVVTQRGSHLYYFDSSGTLLYQSTYYPKLYKEVFPESTITRDFHAKWWLLPLSHSFIAWALFLISGVFGTILKPLIH